MPTTPDRQQADRDARRPRVDNPGLVTLPVVDALDLLARLGGTSNRPLSYRRVAALLPVPTSYTHLWYITRYRRSASERLCAAIADALIAINRSP